MMYVRRLTVEDRPRLRQFLAERWGGEEIVSRVRIYCTEQLEGVVVEDDNKWIGLLTFFIEANECEVTSLDSRHAEQGIGTILLRNAIEEANERNRKRIFLIN